MSPTNLAELYERYIKPLSSADRLRLVTMTTQDLVQPLEDAPPQIPRRITELHGLGADAWKGIDAEEYVEALRREWDDRP